MDLEYKIDENELNKLLKKFGKLKEKVAKKQMRKIFRKAAVPVVKRIQFKAPIDIGKLKDSIGIIPNLGSKTGMVFVGSVKDRIDISTGKKVTGKIPKGVKTKGVHAAFYATFLEFGTKFLSKEKNAFFFKAGLSAIPEVFEILNREVKLQLIKLGI